MSQSKSRTRTHRPSSAYGSEAEQCKAQQQFAVQMYTGTQPKTVRPSHSTTTSGSSSVRTTSSTSKLQTQILATQKVDTGVTDLKEAQRIIDSTKEEINQSH